MFVIISQIIPSYCHSHLATEVVIWSGGFLGSGNLWENSPTEKMCAGTQLKDITAKKREENYFLWLCSQLYTIKVLYI